MEVVFITGNKLVCHHFPFFLRFFGVLYSGWVFGYWSFWIGNHLGGGVLVVGFNEIMNGGGETKIGAKQKEVF